MHSAPPIIKRTNSRLAGMILALMALGGATVIFLFDPATHAFYPVCQFHRLTGLNCPGCGMTRAGYALLHGHFVAALRDNLLFVLGLAALVLRGVWFGARWWQGRANAEFFPAKYFWLLLFISLVFAGLRNLPAFAFLSP
jgi:hypothetical protein